MATRTGGFPRGGWRDTDVWLDPDEVQWFGEVARSVRAAVVPRPLLAGADGSAIALPGPGFGSAPSLPAPRVRSRRPGPSRARRLATRFVPTVAAVAATATGATALLALRAGELPVAVEAAPPARGLQVPGGLPEPRESLPARPAAAAVQGSAAAAAPEDGAAPAIRWRRSRAIGVPHAGRLVGGVRLPVTGPDWVTWDPVLHRVPNRAARLYGTAALVHLVLDVVGGYRAAHPRAPRVVIGDLSLKGGGEIDEHASHENGLDVDVYYPRRDGRLRPPRRADQIDVRLAQDLLDRFVAAGAQVVFVGPSTPLRGPSGVVVPYGGHDNHMHVRLAASR